MAKKKKKSKSPSTVKSFPKKERRKIARLRRRELRTIKREEQQQIDTLIKSYNKNPSRYNLSLDEQIARMESIVKKSKQPTQQVKQPVESNKLEVDFIDDIELQEYEDEIVRQLFKEQANIKRQITRRENKAAKEYAEAWQPDEVRRAEELNEALDTATVLQKGFKHGNGKYTQFLEPLMDKLKQLGYEYDFDDSEGKNFYYKNVRFNELPDDPDVNFYVRKILELDFSSLDNYHKMLSENAASAYIANVFGSKKSPGVEDATNWVALSQYMNSSAAWAIAKKNAPDSDQIKDNWIELYSIGNRAFKENVFDTFIAEVIDNPDGNTVETARDTIEDAITNALKGD